MINSVNNNTLLWESGHINPERWFTLTVRQQQYSKPRDSERFVNQIIMDGVLQMELENKTPVVWTNVTLTIGDDSNVSVGSSQYRNLKFVSCPPI